MTGTLLQTPLGAWHASHGGRMVDFAGWSMPVQYTSIVAEHTATRTAAGLFDISHMGRIFFGGAGAESFLDHLLTRRVVGMTPGQVRYALVTNDAGGILDDVLVYRLPASEREMPYLLVVNASNRQKILNWIEARAASACDLEYTDETEATAMIAVQGPRAAQFVRPLTTPDPTALKYYHTQQGEIAGVPATISRTGYTGEDGWELVVPADAALGVWEELVATGGHVGAIPAGLGCRDTLRLEAAMPLYGHELGEQINPLEAGLAFAVEVDDHSFPGREALIRAKSDSAQPKRVGLELAGKRVPREGFPILSQDDEIGRVTSGTFSPTLERPIAMGYVRPQFAPVGTAVEIDIRGRREPARVVKLPFYRRPAAL